MPVNSTNEKTSIIPRVLIVSNTQFHMSDSNGRILGMLLRSIGNDKKLQFCVRGNSVSSELIKDCYRISDATVLKSVFSARIMAEKLPCDQPLRRVEPNNKKIKRTALSLIVRDLLWNLSFSKMDFISIAKAFQPDIVIWQFSDSGFMAKLALRISSICNAKLAVFTTEDYYFKTWDYLSKKDHTLAYSLFSSGMRRVVKKVFERTDLCVANTQHLADRFRCEFGCRTEVIMNSSEITISNRRINNIENRIVYAGNLGINRHLSIISIARALKEIAPDVRFEVYGNPSSVVADSLEAESNICLMGFVSYTELTEIIYRSRLMIHVESFEDFYRKDLEAAFSTKITDVLCSGTPLFMFAPDNLAETIYLRENGCAFVCSSEKDLDKSLQCALYNQAERDLRVHKGKEMAKNNHDAKKNQQHMLEYLQSI